MTDLPPIERLPYSTPWRERFPEAKLVRAFEGGAIYSAETPDGWWLITDEGTMADLLDEGDRDLAAVLVKVERFEDRDTWARAVESAREGPARRSPVTLARVVHDVPLADRIHGCLIGGAIGDALGAAIEFDDIDLIRRTFGPEGVTDFAPVYGVLGAITDDTQMTLFTAEGLIRANTRILTKGIAHPPSVVDHAYARWLATQGEASGRWHGNLDGWLIEVEGLHERRAPGATNLSALRESEAGSIDRPRNDSKGCGGVMRAAPAGLLAGASRDGAFRLAAQLAALTHGHPSGYLAAGALAEIIDALCGGSSLREAVHRAQARAAAYDGAGEVLAALTSALALADRGGPTDPEAVATLGAGWVAEEALAIGVYAALVASDVRHGLLIAVNHSGDSDSTGAIAGNILGALCGAEAIPAGWREGVELGSTIGALADDWCAVFLGPHPPDPEEDRSWWERYPGW